MGISRGGIKGRRGRGGFTLIELMCGVVILVVSIGAAIASQVISQNLLRTSRETNVATADLQGAMELALERNVAALPIAGSPFEAGVPVAQFTNLHLRNETIVTTYPGYVPGGAVPDPLQVVMTIRWDDWMERPRSLTLATLKTR